jgi:hypothetical protein
MLAALKEKLISGLTLIGGWLVAGLLAGMWLMSRGHPKPSKLQRNAEKEEAAAEAVKPEVVPDDIEMVKKELAKRNLIH